MDPARVASRLRDAYGFDVLRIMHPPALEGDIAWEHCSTRTLS